MKNKINYIFIVIRDEEFLSSNIVGAFHDYDSALKFCDTLTRGEGRESLRIEQWSCNVKIDITWIWTLD